MKLTDCLPNGIVAAGIASYIRLKKFSGNNQFRFRHDGRMIQYEYDDLRTFTYLYNAIQDGRTRESVPLDLLELRPEIDAAFDLGAHFGLYSVILGVLNPETPLYAVEPIPYNFQNLERNIELNGIEATTVNAAVNEHGGQVQMTGGVSGQGLSFYRDTISPRIADELRPMGTPGRGLVSGLQLSEVLSENGVTTPFLKIDIEGAEYCVMRDVFENADVDGMEGFIELHPSLTSDGGSHEILYWFEEHGIDFELIKGHNLARPGYYFSSWGISEADHENINDWLVLPYSR